jgi:hypothetical protein
MPWVIPVKLNALDNANLQNLRGLHSTAASGGFKNDDQGYAL